MATTDADLFADKAKGWDANPIPAQISAGVGAAIEREVELAPGETVMDFGAGTGLIAARVAPKVAQVLAVDVSRAMLDQLAAKPELAGKVEIHCQDILSAPLDRRVDRVVSAMAMHHVEDTAGLLRAFFEHLVPGGEIAVADLDAEDGSFHPPGIEGVYHAGFDREALSALVVGAGFSAPRFVTAVEVSKEDRSYPIFLMTAQKPG